MTISYLDIKKIPAKLYMAENPIGTILAVHGFAGSKESNSILALAERVCPRGLNVLSYDLPMHGERSDLACPLSLDNCINEILFFEQYIKQNLSDRIFAFATSFGGLCLLKRLEKGNDSFEKIVLRVPAVDMAESLLKIAAMTMENFSLELAKERGFVINMGKEYCIPYHFYDQLIQCGFPKRIENCDAKKIFLVYAECDELVDSAATEKFLQLNPEISSLCIKQANHRMSESNHLSQALSASVDFLFGV